MTRFPCSTGQEIVLSKKWAGIQTSDLYKTPHDGTGVGVPNSPQTMRTDSEGPASMSALRCLQLLLVMTPNCQDPNKLVSSSEDLALASFALLQIKIKAARDIPGVTASPFSALQHYTVTANKPRSLSAETGRPLGDFFPLSPCPSAP